MKPDREPIRTVAGWAVGLSGICAMHPEVEDFVVSRINEAMAKLRRTHPEPNAFPVFVPGGWRHQLGDLVPPPGWKPPAAQDDAEGNIIPFPGGR